MNTISCHQYLFTNIDKFKKKLVIDFIKDNMTSFDSFIFAHINEKNCV